MRINKPKLPLNSTPVRARETQGVYSGNGLTPTRQYENTMYAGNVSPNKLNATKKPMPQKNQQPQQMPYIQLNQRRESQSNHPLAMLSKRAGNQCANHLDREGNYRVKIDEQTLYYCLDCSNRIANQGFLVQKVMGPGEINVMGANTILSSRRQSYAAQVPMAFQAPIQTLKKVSSQNFKLQIEPSLSKNPRFLQLQEFVNQCKETLDSFDQNIQGFEQIQGHYGQQQQLIQQFYDAMIDYIRHVKGQHVNLLRNQSNKYVQIAQIQSSEIQENKEQIQGIVNDISECVNDIVSEINEQGFNSCMNQYRQKIQLYRHRVQEQRNTFQEVTKLEHKELEVKLEEFRSTVNSLFGVKQLKGRNQVEPPRQTSTTRMGNVNSNKNNFAMGGVGLINNIGGNSRNMMGNPPTYGFNANNGMNGFNGMNGMNGFNSNNNNNNNNGFGGFENEDEEIQGPANLMRYNSMGSTVPKANNGGPFRTLFNEEGCAQSPQFKNI